MKNAQLPGSYRAWAHDYRTDLPEFIRDVYDLDCTDEQLEAHQGRLPAARGVPRSRLRVAVVAMKVASVARRRTSSPFI